MRKVGFLGSTTSVFEAASSHRWILAPPARTNQTQWRCKREIKYPFPGPIFTYFQQAAIKNLLIDSIDYKQIRWNNTLSSRCDTHARVLPPTNLERYTTGSFLRIQKVAFQTRLAHNQEARKSRPNKLQMPNRKYIRSNGIDSVAPQNTVSLNSAPSQSDGHKISKNDEWNIVKNNIKDTLQRAAAMANIGVLMPHVHIIIQISEVSIRNSGVQNMAMAHKAFKELITRSQDYIKGVRAQIIEHKRVKDAYIDIDNMLALYRSISILQELAGASGFYCILGWVRIKRLSLIPNIFNDLARLDFGIKTLLNLETPLLDIRNEIPLDRSTSSLLFQHLAATPNIKGDVILLCLRSFADSNPNDITSLPELTHAKLLKSLVYSKYYDDALQWIEKYSLDNTYGDIALVALTALKEQVRKLHTGPKHYRPKSGSQNHLNSTGSFSHKRKLARCARSARDVVANLSKHNPDAVRIEHLTILLGIELSDTLLGDNMKLSRDLKPWISLFYKHGIPPNSHAFTMLINAYIKCGDNKFASFIYKQMLAGEVSLKAKNGNVVKIPAPPPNEVTAATMVRAWCVNKDAYEAKSAIQFIRDSGWTISQKLITSIISDLVDRGEVESADELWHKYGAHDNTSSNEVPEDNTHALAKLVYGHAVAGNIDRSVDLFKRACRNETGGFGDSYSRIAHLTSLFNTLLRCTLDSRLIHDDSKVSVKNSSNDIINLGFKFGIRYDIATYNILISRISRFIKRKSSYEDRDGNDDAHAKLSKDVIAKNIHQLYLRMCSEGISPNNTTLYYLIPCWIHLEYIKVAALNWGMYTRDQSPEKLREMKRHISFRMLSWDLDPRILDKFINK